jgi:hypothetical protein
MSHPILNDAQIRMKKAAEWDASFKGWAGATPERRLAIEHAYNLRIDRGEAAFFAEFMNAPLKPTLEATGIDRNVLRERAINLARGVMPTGHSTIDSNTFDHSSGRLSNHDHNAFRGAVQTAAAALRTAIPPGATRRHRASSGHGGRGDGPSSGSEALWGHHRAQSDTFHPASVLGCVAFSLCRLRFVFNVMARNLAPVNIRQESQRIVAGKAGFAALLYDFLSVCLELLPKLISVNAGAGFGPVKHLKIDAPGFVVSPTVI